MSVDARILQTVGRQEGTLCPPSSWRLHCNSKLVMQSMVCGGQTGNLCLLCFLFAPSCKLITGRALLTPTFPVCRSLSALLLVKAEDIKGLVCSPRTKTRLQKVRVKRLRWGFTCACALSKNAIVEQLVHHAGWQPSLSSGQMEVSRSRRAVSGGQTTGQKYCCLVLLVEPL